MRRTKYGKLTTSIPGHPANHDCAECRVVRRRYRKWLDVQLEAGQRQTLPLTGTVRRIRALQALGWPLADIGAAAGESLDQVHRLLSGPNKEITRWRADRFVRAYEVLSGRVGPSKIARSKALRNGYAPPLSWDCIDTDEHPVGVSRAA